MKLLELEIQNKCIAKNKIFSNAKDFKSIDSYQHKFLLAIAIKSKTLQYEIRAFENDYICFMVYDKLLYCQKP